jgi:glutamate N-acetyltransferase / amino-acid N-acetyltransferase
LSASGPSSAGAENRAELPRGFRAGATRAGIKASGNPDLSVILVDGPEPAAVAATFTSNRLPAAPVTYSRERLRVHGVGHHGFARAFICTSGCANAATGSEGLRDQEALAEALAAAAGCRPE